MLGMSPDQLDALDLKTVLNQIMQETLLGDGCGSLLRWCKLQ